MTRVILIMTRVILIMTKVILIMTKVILIMTKVILIMTSSVGRETEVFSPSGGRFNDYSLTKVSDIILDELV
jgi:hypothetical protein